MGKFLLGIGSLFLLIILIIWLWQRQPTEPMQIASAPETKTTASENSDNTKLNPDNNLVLKSDLIAIKSKTSPNNYFVIASETTNLVNKSDTEGNINLQINLQKGLNLIKLTQISEDLKVVSEEILTYYVDKDESAKTVYSGTVKSIFDTLITLTAPDGEINISTSQTTKLDIPKPEDSENESTQSALNAIRVGDYGISLGEKSEKNTQVSKSLSILRDTKPANGYQILTTLIVSNPNKNLFSAKSLTDSKVFDLALDKNSQFQDQNQQPSPSPKTSTKTQTDQFEQIVKDKKAIVIFHSQKDKNIVDRIFLLP